MKPHEYLKLDIDALLIQSKDQVSRDYRNKDELDYIVGLKDYLDSISVTTEIENKIDLFCENYLKAIFTKRNVFASLLKTNEELRSLKQTIREFLIELIGKKIITQDIETNNLYEIFSSIIDPNKLMNDKDKKLFLELKAKVEQFEPKYLVQIIENSRNFFEFETARIFFVFHEILEIRKNELVDPKESINFLKQKIEAGKITNKSVIELFETLNIFKAIRDCASHGNESYEHIREKGKVKFTHRSERNPTGGTVPKLEFYINELASYYRKLLCFVDLFQRFFLMNYCIRHQSKKANELFQQYEDYHLEENEKAIIRHIEFY
jgi:hypothetical protein